MECGLYIFSNDKSVAQLISQDCQVMPLITSFQVVDSLAALYSGMLRGQQTIQHNHEHLINSGTDMTSRRYY
jgi:Na+-driven multidrug efflux pump